MKKIYWRPAGVSQSMLLLMAGIAILGMFTVEQVKTATPQKMYKEKMKAARRMEESMRHLAQEREKRTGRFIDTDYDRFESGMLGEMMSEITSTSGNITAKLSTTNPNWAAVMVELFRKAKLKSGDTVAIGLSGSFPALNLATLIAADVMKLKVITIVGVTASMWGANIPTFTWLDMEESLHEHRLISTRSIAASIGGQGDRGRGLSREGKQATKTAIERNSKLPSGDTLEFIEAKSFESSLEQRMSIYDRIADDQEIKAYVNVGGNTVSVGSILGKKLYKEGLNKRPSAKALKVDCVMTRFAKRGLPVIHMIRVKNLAAKFGLPYELTKRPRVGEGSIFKREEYNLWLTSGVILLILALLYIFMKSDIGYRIFNSAGVKEEAGPPSPMV